MLNDAFKLTLDLIYKPPKKSGYEQPYHVKGQPDNVNLFDKICNIGSVVQTGVMEYTSKSKFVPSQKTTDYQINQEFIKNLTPSTN